MEKIIEKIDVWDAVNERDHLNKLKVLEEMADQWEKTGELPAWAQQPVKNALALMLSHFRRQEIALADIYKSIAHVAAGELRNTDRIEALEKCLGEGGRHED